MHYAWRFERGMAQNRTRNKPSASKIGVKQVLRTDGHFELRAGSAFRVGQKMETSRRYK